MQGLLYKGEYEEQCLPAALTIGWHSVDGVE